MNMKKLFCIVAFLLTAIFQMSAQNVIRVEAPDVVAVNEQFNVTFIIEGEKSPSDFQWSSGDDFQLVWGPQKGSSSSIQIINGKRSSSHQTTFTYILIPKATGTFQLPAATALLSGDRISSTQASIQVVSDGASSSQSSGQNGGKSSGGGQTSSTGSGEISSNDLFMRLSLSRTEVVIGEPITATLKIYQRANVVGFENAKFPTFNGFWSQETYVPNNIEFKRESLDDKIYNTAVLRTYVLIPQQSGTITIDPAELVCLVNIRTAPSTSNSLFDSFFQDEYRTIRKRVTTPAVKVKVNPLPAGQPAEIQNMPHSVAVSEISEYPRVSPRTTSRPTMLPPWSSLSPVAEMWLFWRSRKSTSRLTLRYMTPRQPKTPTRATAALPAASLLNILSSREVTETSRSIRWNIPTMMSMPVNM